MANFVQTIVKILENLQVQPVNHGSCCLGCQIYKNPATTTWLRFYFSSCSSAQCTRTHDRMVGSLNLTPKFVNEPRLRERTECQSNFYGKATGQLDGAGLHIQFVHLIISVVFLRLMRSKSFFHRCYRADQCFVIFYDKTYRLLQLAYQRVGSHRKRSGQVSLWSNCLENQLRVYWGEAEATRICH